MRSALRNGSENNRSPCPDSNWAPLSSPPPAHPSTASTPPSPDRSAPDDKPTAPHRSFPPSASRSVDFPDLLQHVVTRLRIDSSYLHEFPSRVDQALADDSFSLSTKVAGQRV